MQSNQFNKFKQIESAINSKTHISCVRSLGYYIYDFNYIHYTHLRYFKFCLKSGKTINDIIKPTSINLFLFKL